MSHPFSLCFSTYVPVIMSMISTCKYLIKFFPLSHTQRPPVAFVLDNLEATTSYRLILFAVNAKGRSEPVIIDDISFKGVAKFTGKFCIFSAEFTFHLTLLLPFYSSCILPRSFALSNIHEKFTLPFFDPKWWICYEKLKSIYLNECTAQFRVAKFNFEIKFKRATKCKENSKRFLSRSK